MNARNLQDCLYQADNKSKFISRYLYVEIIREKKPENKYSVIFFKILNNKKVFHSKSWFTVAVYASFEIQTDYYKSFFL